MQLIIIDFQRIFINKKEQATDRISVLVQAEYSPEIDFNFGYAYNDQEAEASQLRFLTTQGLNYNFTARLNLFQGFNQFVVLLCFGNLLLHLKELQFMHFNLSFFGLFN